MGKPWGSRPTGSTPIGRVGDDKGIESIEIPSNPPLPMGKRPAKIRRVLLVPPKEESYSESALQVSGRWVVCDAETKERLGDYQDRGSALLEIEDRGYYT